MPSAVQFKPHAHNVGRFTDPWLADLCRADVKAFLEDGETVRLLVSLEGKDLAVVSRMRPAVSSWTMVLMVAAAQPTALAALLALLSMRPACQALTTPCLPAEHQAASEVQEEDCVLCETAARASHPRQHQDHGVYSLDVVSLLEIRPQSEAFAAGCPTVLGAAVL